MWVLLSVGFCTSSGASAAEAAAASTSKDRVRRIRSSVFQAKPGYNKSPPNRRRKHSGGSVDTTYRSLTVAARQNHRGRGARNDASDDFLRAARVSKRLFGRHSRSEEHTSELQSHSFISYAVFCLKKK